MYYLGRSPSREKAPASCHSNCFAKQVAEALSALDIPSAMKNGSENPQPTTVKETVVETVEAPRLTDIQVSEFVTLKPKRATYERHASEKNAGGMMSIPLKTYLNSIDEAVLRLFVIAKWAPTESVEEISEDHLATCVEERARVELGKYDLCRIEFELKDVKLGNSTKIPNIEKQFRRLCLKYFTTLQRWEYEEFLTKKPKLSIKHMLKSVTHKQLLNRIRMILDLRQDELKVDFNFFCSDLG